MPDGSHMCATATRKRASFEDVRCGRVLWSICGFSTLLERSELFSPFALFAFAFLKQLNLFVIKPFARTLNTIMGIRTANRNLQATHPQTDRAARNSLRSTRTPYRTKSSIY